MKKRLLVGFVLFAIIATALLVIPLGLNLEVRERTGTLKLLTRDASDLSALLSDALSHNDVVRAVELSHSYTRSTDRGVLVVDSTGVLISSVANQASDHALLAIAASIQRSTSAKGSKNVEKSGISASTTPGGPLYYVATSLSSVRDPALDIDNAVLIVTSPVKVVDNEIFRNWRDLVLYGVLMLLAACFFGVIISSSLVRPLKKMVDAVEAMGHGSLEVRAPVSVGPHEFRVLGEAFNSTSDRLITLLQAQRAFVEDASHQLRTPLTSLQLQLENLQRHDGMSEVEELDGVVAEMSRLQRLVDSLLALARNEASNSLLVSVDLAEAIGERVALWCALADEMSLELRSTVTGKLRVLIVEDAMAQILDNLLANAFDATPSGGCVEVNALRIDGRIELHVGDSGPGLTPAERAMALRRFWRGPNSHNEGTGLGLAIVDQLVHQSGATVELRPAALGGLDVTVTFRCADEA